MTLPFTNRRAIAKLEVLLAVASLVLIWQLFPSFVNRTIVALNVMRWTASAWLALNAFAIASLMGVRYGPSVVKAWREYRTRKEAGLIAKKRIAEMRGRRELIERRKSAQSKRRF